MKKILSKLKEIDSRIADCENEITAVSKLPFYSIFGKEAQRKKDLDNLGELKEILLREKLQVLTRLRSFAKQEAKTVMKEFSLKV